MRKTMDQIISYSPEFRLKKLNNYDNAVRNVSRQIYESCDLDQRFKQEVYNSRNNKVSKAETMEPKAFYNLGFNTTLQKQESPALMEKLGDGSTHSWQ